jgi:hypothetical protein
MDYIPSALQRVDHCQQSGNEKDDRFLRDLTSLRQPFLLPRLGPHPHRLNLARRKDPLHSRLLVAEGDLRVENRRLEIL